MSARRVIKVAAFVDGRPGHQKQTEGILKWLSKKVQVDVDYIVVKKESFLQQLIGWVRLLLPWSGTAGTDDNNYDLLIGTGTHTHLPMLLLKKRTKIPVVSCMTPSSVLVNAFDLLFIPKHDNVTARNNIILTIGPPNTCEDYGHHEEQRVLVLVGGVDPKSHIWKTDEIVEQIKELLAHNPDKKFVISSSPRTPPETEDALALSVEGYSNVQFFRYKTTEPGWVEKEYNRCRYVWVTGDSVSMVYEALSSGCLVGIIPVHWRNVDSKIPRSIKYLEKSGRVLSLDAHINEEADWRGSEPLNEAERCAAAIAERWT